MALSSMDALLARIWRRYLTPQGGVPEDATYEEMNLGPGDHITPAVRRAGFQALVNYCYANGYSLVIPDVPGETYDIDDSISVRECPGLTVHQLGHMLNVSEDSTQGGLKQVIWKLGNQHPSDWDTDSGPLTFLACGTTVVGSKQVTISSGTLENDSTGKIVGGLAIIRSVASWSTDYNDPYYLRISRVTAYDAGSGLVTLEDEFDQAHACVISMGGNATAEDPQGEPLFIADSISIIGSGSLETAGHVFQRTAAYNCMIKLASVRNKSVFFGNAYVRSHVEFEKSGTATYKAVDIAGNSSFTDFITPHIFYEGAGVDGLNAVVMNERAYGCTLRVGTFTALNFTAAAGLINFNTCDSCSMDFDLIDAPKVTTWPIRFTNAVTDGDNQATLHGNSLRVGRGKFGSFTGYYINVDNSGGENKRQHIDVRLEGTPSIAAVRIGGDGHMISPSSQFQSGALLIEATGEYHPTNLVADGISFPGGITGSTAGQRIRTFA